MGNRSRACARAPGRRGRRSGRGGLKPWLREQWCKGKQGLAIFSDWRRYAREVALPSGASYRCRIGVNVVFMAAFDIPVTVFTVALVASSHMLSGLFAITPGRDGAVNSRSGRE